MPSQPLHEKLAYEREVTHERFTKLVGAYTGFVAAAIISLISGDGHIKSENWAICFWALSLPPLVALLLLDFIVRVRQSREKSKIRGCMAFLGYGFSNLGTASLLTHYSWWAAIIFLVLIPLCALFTHEVAGLGRYEGYEDF